MVQMEEELFGRHNCKMVQLMKKDMSKIPMGGYCYEIIDIVPSSKDGCVIRTKPCPYWSRRKGLYGQVDGYCSYLDIGDEYKGASGMLFDQVKECNINTGDENG